jgi:amino acid adenylation domain-containing protein
MTRGLEELSCGQQALWYLQQIAPDSTAYHLVVVLRPDVAVELPRLQLALAALVARHPMLTAAPALEVVELDDDGGPIEPALRTLASRPFDLPGPMFRACLVRRGADALVMLVSHHLVADGFSLAILARELPRLYRDPATDGLAPGAPFGDFVRCQRALVGSPEGQAQLDYWRGELGGELPVLALPTDRPRPRIQTYEGAAIELPLEEPLVELLRALAAAESTTLFVVVLAAFQALLHRTTGQDDVPTGVPMLGRDRRFLRTVGYFSNPVVVRTRFSARGSFVEVVRQVRDKLHLAQKHQDYPFPLLVEALRPVRDPGHSPLFQVMFDNWQGLDRNARWPYFGVPMQDGAFDLVGYLLENDHRIRVRLGYNRDLFDASSIAELGRQLGSLLTAVAAAPERPVDAIALGAPVAGSPATPYPDRAVPQLVDEQVRRRPDVVALVFGAERLTYAALAARVDRSARGLVALGVAPGQRVGVVLHRSIDLVVALLATMTAGAAYVPIDPDYPASRIAFMLEDAAVAAIVTEDGLRDRLPATEARVVIAAALAATGEAAPSAPSAIALPVLGAESLAYVIYTSGSTGRPKGVQIRQRALVNLLWSMASEPGLHEDDVLLALTTLSFDIAALELWLPLITGATLVLAPREAQGDGVALGRLLAACGATVMQATPATWKLLLDSGWPGAPRLRALCGGEALSASLARQLLERCGALWNLYGPTETTIWSAVHRVEPARSLHGPTVPIGHPIANTQLHVLDDQLQPCGIGVVGELFIGGDGVSPGYLGLPALDAEKFVTVGAARLFRTGDQVRRRGSGELEFLGRRDHQIKLRGFRIELGEIEAALVAQPGVTDAVVVVRSFGPDDQRLVGYYVAGQPLPLRPALAAVLPQYMVPASLIRLDALPRTPNGKLDRARLPAPEAPAPETAARGDAGSPGELEQLVQRAWSETLAIAVDAADLDRNFFDLGGHSLLLPALHRRLEAATGRAFPLVTLFEHPTVRRFAAYLGAAGPAHHPGGLAGRAQLSRAPGAGAVAIIGMAGRFPGADDLAQFWDKLVRGEESISVLGADELRQAGVPEIVRTKPNYVPAKGVLERAEWFDPGFFQLTDREARLLDPQHRVFLETAWTALEDGGYSGGGARIGVYAGAEINTYLPLLPSEAMPSSASLFQAFVANDKDFLATRVSYCLNLTGPSMTIQTACSTALVAIHQARMALVNGECELALAGGVCIRFPQRAGYLFDKGMILSPDGHCRAFDRRAAGTVPSEGVGVVLLKPLEDAVRDGDRIYAVIRGSAVNNDGATKVGYTAPSVGGQADVIRRALASAGVAPEAISYVEAHGTGTALGDPIEITALGQALQTAAPRATPCWIGSVKSNIGHTSTAAGAAGLIKTALALAHQQLPASLHFEDANPALDLQAGPFAVNAQTRPWPAGDGPRRAGVSSFGIGGTNAHVILEEAPPAPVVAAVATYPDHLLAISAKDRPALVELARRYADRLRGSEADAAAVCATAATRPAFRHRLTLRAATAGALRDQALAFAEGRPGPAVYRDTDDGALAEATRRYAGAGLPRVALPPYPFQRRRFSFDDAAASEAAPAATAGEGVTRDADREQALLQLVTAQVADVLGLDPGDGVSEQQSLQQLGVTSLAAIELTTKLETELGVLLPSSLTAEDRTIAGVVAWLCEHLDGLPTDE